MDFSVLTKKQWQIVLPFLPQPVRRADGKGRPACDPAAVLAGILWILRTGAPWKDLPPRFPAYQTCHRYFQVWIRKGVLRRILLALARDLEGRGGYDLSECFVDATFASAKKGGLRLAKLSAAKEAKSWQSATAQVFLSPYPSIVLRRMKSRS